MQITWRMVTSAFRLDFAGHAVLIDPFFTGNPAFVSHKAAASKGVKRYRADARPRRSCRRHARHREREQRDGDNELRSRHVARFEGTTQNLNPMNTGGTTDLGGFTVSLVRADHSSGEMVDGASIYLGNSCGAIIKAPGEPTVYHLGDTDIFSDMALIAEIHQPRIAMVPIGDRFTMGAATAAMAVKRFFKLDAVIPCHYGSFPIVDATAAKFVGAMRGNASKVIVPEKNESHRALSGAERGLALAGGGCACKLSSKKRSARFWGGRCPSRRSRYSRSGLLRCSQTIRGMSLRVIPMSANSRSLNWESSCTASPYRFQLWKKRITGDNMGFVLFSGIWPESQKKNMGLLYCSAIKIGAVQLILNGMANDRYLLDLECSSAQWSVTLH